MSIAVVELVRTGSIGFIRGQGLDHLQHKLFSRGWR